ncbi:hypothetical protein TNCV_746911 [Trichonephila clavipes]|nr:hypothetical protein TNCV_746911 [Trichonephila clavipes]
MELSSTTSSSHNILKRQGEENKIDTLAWFDISNAFDSVPHDVIINALVPKHTTCVMPVGMYIIKKIEV